MTRKFPNLERLVSQCKGNISEMARRLGCARPTVVRKLKDAKLERFADVERARHLIKGPRASLRPESPEAVDDKRQIVAVLDRTASNRTHPARAIQGLQWDFKAAAAELGMSVRTLYRRLEQYRIDGPPEPSLAERRRCLVAAFKAGADDRGNETQMGAARVLEVSHTTVQEWCAELLDD